MLKFFNLLSFLDKKSSINDENHAYEGFLKDYPQFSKTHFLDELRATDFDRLDKQKHIYLDFTGGHLYGESLVKSHQGFLCKSILGNPHSINPSSALSENHIQATRRKVLDYFNASGDYHCVFTSNASSALKIIGECYPFGKGDQLLLATDNHNSVNGLREFARTKHADYTYSPLNQELRIDDAQLTYNLTQLKGQNKLFAYPAQSNVSGVKHELEWIKKAQRYGWDVLLDAAAFVPSDNLDLQKYQPEFVSISFYKIFGYPTGMGALLVKKSAFNKLQKPSFAGGTITIVSVHGDGYHLDNGPARFEEGTLNYLEIPAIKTGLEYIENIGLENIEARVNSLTGYLIQELLKLKHKNGKPLIQIYGPKNNHKRGGTIALNFHDQNGLLHDFQTIERDAYEENISLRTGCFCNPGIDETNHHLSPEKLQSYFKRSGRKDYFDLIDFIDQKRGAVRVSVGYISNFKDIIKFLSFCKGYINKKAIS